MDPSQHHLFLASDGRRIVIRPGGRCSAVFGGAVERFLRSAAFGAGQDIYFDLSLADMLESTFAGLLVSLARRKGREPNSPSFHLLSPSPSALAALDHMGLTKLFDICDSLSESPGQWTALPVEGTDPAALAELIVRAHECLIAADPRNEEAFGCVVRGFRAAGAAPKAAESGD